MYIYNLWLNMYIQIYKSIYIYLYIYLEFIVIYHYRNGLGCH